MSWGAHQDRDAFLIHTYTQPAHTVYTAYTVLGLAISIISERITPYCICCSTDTDVLNSISLFHNVAFPEDILNVGT
jgi:hypothetical protein